MKYYQVNNLKFSFTNQSNEFFVNNIEKYEIEPCDVFHHIETILVDQITIPSFPPTVELADRKVYVCDQDETVVIFQNDIPVILIEKAHNYDNMYLYIQKDIKGLSEIEYVYTGIIFMELCLYHQMQSIHGSAITYNNQVVIFSGPSGIGKSTHVNYWKELYPSIEIINDDKPLLWTKDNTVYVSGSPWSGKTKTNKNISLPLHSIVFLNQGNKNEVSLIEDKDKMIHIMRNINRPRQNHLWDQTNDILLKLITTVPMYKATVTHDKDSVNQVKSKIGV